MYFCVRSVREKGFTLIELLIVIAIIAVLAVVLVLVLNPIQIIAKARDGNRLSDLPTLNTVLGLYIEDVGASMGSSSVTYISIPDPAATSSAGTDCSGLGFPGGGSFHCAGPSTYRNTDGTGWIPVNLGRISSKSPLGAFPVDPVNSFSSHLYYFYQANGTKFKLAAFPESQTQIAKTGLNPYLFTAGTTPMLNSGSWVLVPSNAAFGTPNFYVMKYDASCSDGNGNYLNDFDSLYHTYNDASSTCNSANGRAISSLAGGWPIGFVSYTSAISYCQSVGAHLLTNDEYMTVSTNAANLGSNWSGGSPGSGYLYSGHNDANPNLALAADSNDANGYFGEGNTGGNQKRTFTLSNGSVVWDFAGNILQFVGRSVNNVGNATNTMALPSCSNSTGAFEWCEYAAPGSPTISAYSADVTQARVAPPNATWYSNQGMGEVYTYGTGANQGTTVFARGGAWDDTADAGAFSLYLSWNTSAKAAYIGFRCAW